MWSFMEFILQSESSCGFRGKKKALLTFVSLLRLPQFSAIYVLYSVVNIWVHIDVTIIFYIAPVTKFTELMAAI